MALKRDTPQILHMAKKLEIWISFLGVSRNLRKKHNHVFPPHELEDCFREESCAYTKRRVAKNEISNPGLY
jgi:hypothetical protein